jgi:ribosome-associated translation inhibitor RaiA
MPILKQLVSFRGLDDSAHASIAQQIGELAAHLLNRHLHPLSTELISLRARVERDTLRTGDADRVKLRLELSTATRAAGEVAEHETAALKTAFDEFERQLERHTSHLLKMDSWRRNARRDSRVRLKTVVVAGTPGRLCALSRADERAARACATHCTAQTCLHAGTRRSFKRLPDAG